MLQKKKHVKQDLKTISKIVKKSLPKVEWSPTPLLDLEILIAHVIQKDRLFVSMNPQHPIQQQQANTLQALVERREKQEPIAYIIGSKHFYNYDFHVNKNVLIPRPETELLIENALNYIENHEIKSIVDIGTGSGCIIITIAKELQKREIINEVSFIATEVSNKAINTAQQNYNTHFPKGSTKVNFVETNLLEKVNEKVDVLLSNLPYIPQKEYEGLENNVRGFEPKLALVGGEKGEELIEKLLRQATQKVNPKSLILLEINHDQGEIVANIARKHFPKSEIVIIKDYANFDRIAKIENF